jgi:hypothetical protein
VLVLNNLPAWCYFVNAMSSTASDEDRPLAIDRYRYPYWYQHKLNVKYRA